MRIIACAYRSWGVKAAQALSEMLPEHELLPAATPEEFTALFARGGADVVLALGWSWLFEASAASASWIVGVHPSDLPEFAGGSPIQNQILAGVTRTKATLFRITPELDGGPILGKVPLSLEGHVDDIFERLTTVSVVLCLDFLRAFPDVQGVPQGEVKTLRRLKPDSGRLTAESFITMSSRQLYDAIRCREAPYPNAYLEDEAGVLRFARVEFIPKL